MKKTFIIVLIAFISFHNLIAEIKSVVPIKTRGNITLLTVKVGNIEIPNIILDTGMPYNGLLIYNTKYLDSIDLRRAIQVNIGGAGSGDASQALMFDSAKFFIGELELKNQPIIMLTDKIYEGFPTNGVIGYSILGQFITQIDYENLTMTLYDKSTFKVDSTWKEIPIYFKENRIPWLDIYVVINNEKPVLISAYIDFAANDEMLLLEKEGMKFAMPPKKEKVLLGRGLSGEIYGHKTEISKLIIGLFELKSVNGGIAPAEVRSKQKDADAIISSGVLRKFNIIFDYENNKIYLKPNSAFK